MLPETPTMHTAPQGLPPDILPSGAPRRFVLFGAILFFASLLFYIGLSAGYESFLRRSIQSLENQRESLAAQLTGEDQKNLVTLYSQIVNLRTLLGDHVFAAKLFPILERNTHPDVAYLTLNLSVPDRELVIEGVAASYDALVSQLAIYEAAPEIERVALQNSRTDGGIVNFTAVLTLAPDVLQGVPTENTPNP